MKSFIAILALVAVAAADVSHLRSGGNDRDAQVTRLESEVNPDSFQYAYETSNGIAGQESGQLKNFGSESAVVVQGSNQYTNPEGQQVVLTYVADENGYQPQGSHLPTPPPIPEAIQRSLEFLRANPQQPERPVAVNYQAQARAQVAPAPFGRFQNAFGGK